MADSALQGIHFVKRGVGEFQAGAGRNAAQALPHNLERAKDQAGPGPRDMRKQTMFDRVVLRAIGRIVGHANRNAERVDQPLQILFEDVMPAIVAAAAVAQQQDRRGPRIGPRAVPLPPQAKTVASELARVVACASGRTSRGE